MPKTAPLRASLLALLASSVPGAAQVLFATGNVSRVPIDRGLAWLVAHQEENGRFDPELFWRHDKKGTPCDGGVKSTRDVALTSLVTIALAGAGHGLPF